MSQVGLDHGLEEWLLASRLGSRWQRNGGILNRSGALAVHIDAYQPVPSSVNVRTADEFCLAGLFGVPGRY